MIICGKLDLLSLIHFSSSKCTILSTYVHLSCCHVRSKWSCNEDISYLTFVLWMQRRRKNESENSKQRTKWGMETGLWYYCAVQNYGILFDVLVFDTRQMNLPLYLYSTYFYSIFYLSVALTEFTILQEEKWEEAIKRPSSWFHKFII